jgi:hypothetical protein
MEARDRDVMEARDRDVMEAEEEERPLSTADLAARAHDGDGAPAGERETRDSGQEGRSPRQDGGRRDDDVAPDEDTAPATAEPLFPKEKTDAFQGRWVDIQARFVDEPRQSVQDADSLVAELMQQLADGFSRVRSDLEGQWDRGDAVSTEDLRVALQRYRAFFERLLAA